MRDTLKQIVNNITPYDNKEMQDQKETFDWLNTNKSIYRCKKPDIPNKHLVSYFVLYDDKLNNLLLVDHINAQLWLPTGGHVDINEDPKQTVIRECYEELGIKAKFWIEEPLFLTSAVTVGLTAGHTDISFWYVLKGNASMKLDYDRNEFHGIRWFNVNDIPYERTEPSMKRFIGKLLNKCKTLHTFKNLSLENANI